MRFLRPLVRVVALATLGASAAAAQQPQQQSQQQPAPQAAARLDDATLLAIFDAGNSYDMQTGALARARGHSAEVRQFGAMLERDHRAVRRIGRDLAGTLVLVGRLPQNFEMEELHREAMTTLRSVQGREFDRVFLEHEVEYHTGMAQALRGTLIPAATDPRVKRLLEQLAGAVDAHKLQAQTLLARTTAR